MKEKSSILQQFGRNIRTLREAQDLSQEEFAALVGLDRTYIGGIERGERNTGVLNVCRIAHTLGVTPARLLAELEECTPNPPNKISRQKMKVEGSR